MRPSVGRIVHYVAYGTPIREDGTQAFPSACRAALVTEVGAWVAEPSEAADTYVGRGGKKTRIVVEAWHEDACHLDVHTPTGGFHNVCLHDEDTKAGGSWGRGAAVRHHRRRPAPTPRLPARWPVQGNRGE